VHQNSVPAGTPIFQCKTLDYKCYKKKLHQWTLFICWDMTIFVSNLQLNNMFWNKFSSQKYNTWFMLSADNSFWVWMQIYAFSIPKADISLVISLLFDVIWKQKNIAKKYRYFFRYRFSIFFQISQQPNPVPART
jgi:hypothetical protein